MSDEALPQWQKAIVTYLTVSVIFALILGVAIYFEFADRDFLIKFGGLVSFLIVLGLAIRLPLSIGAYFYHLHPILVPVGLLISVTIGVLSLIPAIANFWFFASEFERPIFDALTQSTELVISSELRWWHFIIFAGSTLMALVGVYGAAKGRI